MEHSMNTEPNPNNDYFAKELLNKLPKADPIFAAYEAQDVSREVGFDFASFTDVVPRALDEIRETKEAYEEGPEGRDHFGDEIADIMFSFVNLARHAGNTTLPTYDSFSDQVASLDLGDASVEDIVDGIADQISLLDSVAKTNPEQLQDAALAAFNEGVIQASALAVREGFDPKELLTENVRKYLVRCDAIEQLAAEDDKTWADLSRENEIIAYWKRAKTLLN